MGGFSSKAMAQRKQLFVDVYITKLKIMQGVLVSFGLPLTETLTIETKLKTAVYIIPQVGASWLF